MLALSQEQTSISTFYGPTGARSACRSRRSSCCSRTICGCRDSRSPVSRAERKLPWGVYGKMNLISREGSRGFTFEDTPVSPSLNLYVLDNIQRQHYRAAEFAFRRTFLSKYQWFASYTRSGRASNAVVNYTVDNPIFAPQAAGPLPWDAPNRFLMWGWAPVEKDWFPHFLQRIVGETDVELLGDFRSGFPFTAVTETGNLRARRTICASPFTAR